MSRFTAYGVDGCPGGWFYVALESSAPPRRDVKSWGVVKELVELVRDARESDRIFVDIPIGLPDESIRTRECDTMARSKLGGPRSSSVFPTPARAALGAGDYQEAKRRNLNAIGKKISTQTFQIVPKIREVDSLLGNDEKARCVVREIHPEICFWAFTGRPMKHGKRSEEGYAERLAVLESVRPSARQEIEEILKKFRRKVVSRDDAVDAMAAAITAATETRNLQTLPPCPPTDSKGLPMEMVYAKSPHARLGA